MKATIETFAFITAGAALCAAAIYAAMFLPAFILSILK